jgi:hypothetical protein
MDINADIYGNIDTDSPDVSINDSKNTKKVYDKLKSRLNLSIYDNITSYSVINTLKYLFYHMKCGIYVMIRDNKVQIFSPFVNKNYKNNWEDNLKIDGRDLENYYQKKSEFYRNENIIDKHSWWANGNIICNEEDRTETASEHGRISTNQWYVYIPLPLILNPSYPYPLTTNP